MSSTVHQTQQPVWLSRGVSLGWGLVAVLSGLVFARSERTVIELINLIGSAFYGPVLAVFALAIYLPGSSGRAVVTGFLGGLACNLAVRRSPPSPGCGGIPWVSPPPWSSPGWAPLQARGGAEPLARTGNVLLTGFLDSC